jgi:hypothetical protein
MLTVDVGPEHPARFYRLIIGGRGHSETVTEELLVPDGDELKITHRHDSLDEAA